MIFFHKNNSTSDALTKIKKRIQKGKDFVQRNESEDKNEHFYLSDSIFNNEIIQRCHIISETQASARLVILYADKNARRFYERNLFQNFEKFMLKEKNMEIMKNEPMYLSIE